MMCNSLVFCLICNRARASRMVESCFGLRPVDFRGDRGCHCRGSEGIPSRAVGIGSALRASRWRAITAGSTGRADQRCSGRRKRLTTSIGGKIYMRMRRRVARAARCWPSGWRRAGLVCVLRQGSVWRLLTERARRQAMHSRPKEFRTSQQSQSRQRVLFLRIAIWSINSDVESCCFPRS